MGLDGPVGEDHAALDGPNRPRPPHLDRADDHDRGGTSFGSPVERAMNSG